MHRISACTYIYLKLSQACLSPEHPRNQPHSSKDLGALHWEGMAVSINSLLLLKFTELLPPPEYVIGDQWTLWNTIGGKIGGAQWEKTKCLWSVWLDTKLHLPVTSLWDGWMIQCTHSWMICILNTGLATPRKQSFLGGFKPIKNKVNFCYELLLFNNRCCEN